ncbi:cellulase family glycosylhydrolase [Actinomadura sp. WMMB 499]|uniref:cellulase family glycosylhydrolase n=1 Tax=Actinomadura sp. WMMB 499 TaxID=1219491 RepID=UPI001246C9D4|nr:cellulase family glycosylhydrolase [Actinomadura sp. WMMB 499]QFG27299.1 glycoside hydrolase family 5 protein [Actinomadura sp. WMMB 499]
MRARTARTARNRGRIALTAVLASALAAATVTTLPAPPARADEAAPPTIVDERGRTLILHGLNTASSAKGPSGLPWIERADVAREARELGTNSVRYLVQWKNIEPEPGRYDDAYLDDVAERVAWYREQGMHVILDMHQDIYGPAACEGSGNGAPAWATHTDGLPCTPQTPWVLTYVQPAVIRAYDHFWNNTGEHPELKQRYTAMWRHVAQRFADDPAVLGYDLYNEPFGGTRQFGFFEGPILTPFYQGIVNAIREVDRDNWIFVAPQALGPNEGAETSLGTIGDPRPGDPRLVFAPHFYPGGVDIGGSYDGFTELLVKAQFLLWKRNMPAAARRLGMPIWLGEVGGMPASAPGAAEFTGDWLEMADDLGIGWAYWSSDPGGAGPTDGDGNPTLFAELLARPYPRAVAGTPTEISYDGTSLKVGWRARSGTSGPTEIWFPTDSPVVTSTDPEGTWKYRWDAQRRVLSVWADPNSPTHTVTVEP